MKSKPLGIIGRGTLEGRKMTCYSLRPEVARAVKEIADGPAYLAAEFLILMGIRSVLQSDTGILVTASDINEMCPPETPGHESTKAA